MYKLYKERYPEGSEEYVTEWVYNQVSPCGPE